MNDLFEFPPESTKVVNMTDHHYDVRLDRKTKWAIHMWLGFMVLDQK